VPDLNIEGGALLGDSLWLAQRGNGAGGMNALIRLRIDAHANFHLRDIVPVELPAIAGVPLTLTDLEPFHRRLLFTAAAEDTRDTYLDGAVAGSAVGVLDPATGAVHELEIAPEAVKLEGVARYGTSGGRDRLHVAADPDDSSRPGVLYTARGPEA
jgi:hypothetical protein